MKKIMMLAVATLPLLAYGQDNLIIKLEGNKKTETAANDDKKYIFSKLISLENTSVKNQASSGTCWSYSTNSFLESEMMRMGKTPVQLAQLYSARMVYEEKADNYVRMHGSLSWGDGGECHDVINMYAKYGAMPQSVYTGLHYGTDKNKFAEFQGMLKAMLDVVVANHNGKLSTSWKTAYDAVLDAYLGPVPQTFTWEHKTYTPQSFAKEVVGIHAEDYVEIGSMMTASYYKQTTFMVPDNWSFEKVYNVKMDDLTDIIDHALNGGYTVAWATDVSEKYFSWKNGVAYVPEKDYDDMDDTEKKHMFDGPMDERHITPELRQKAFDNYETTDDHGMHIVGMAKDQIGRHYYIVKNSWGEKNDYKGYIYVTKAYIKYKTTAILLHKNGVPAELRKKMGLYKAGQ
jgi:bleomycin hydrolase